jgi:methyl-accepting chemotaxis protein
MNFRTKIWMLPISAAAVFVVGVGVSFAVGERTSGVLKHLHEVDNPHMAYVNAVDRSAEQLRLTLQTAAVEGDPEKLKETDVMVASAHDALAGMQKLPEKAAVAKDLSEAFDAYQTNSIGAIRAMLTQQPQGDMVQKMQSSLVALQKQLDENKASAKAAIDTAQDTARQGVNTNLWVTITTGVIVLAVLGLASAAIVTSVWQDLGDEPSNLRQMVRRIAEGDLDVDMGHVSADDKSLRSSVMTMTHRLRDTIALIRQATDSISTASTEIASGNQDLSSRTENTASNLQQTASSMEELTGNVRQSADAARQANQLASGAASAAQRGEDIVSQVVSNMSEIDNASRKITEIITVIDGIAFQTNILALNAAVEAARAGEQGRGFAVVAGEVRSLAQRSANAAKEIKTLINASSEKVESGSKLVKDAGSSMLEILTSVQRVSDIIGEITAASAEQSQGIGTVNQSVNELDQMTQQNAALVEQSAAAAESLKDQATRLAQAVSAFKLGQGQRVAEATHVATTAIVKAKTSSAPAAKPSYTPPKPAAAPRAAAPAVTYNDPVDAPQASAKSTGHDADWETF